MSANDNMNSVVLEGSIKHKASLYFPFLNWNFASWNRFLRYLCKRSFASTIEFETVPSPYAGWLIQSLKMTKCAK